MTAERVRLFVATSNVGKLRDFAWAAAALASTESEAAVDLLVLPGLDKIPAPVEDETTFEGNARLKATYYSRSLPGEIVLADDSGLEVDSLAGAPGVRSARYAEDCGFVVETASVEGGLSVDLRNNLCVLAAMAARGDGTRRARYRCVLAAARDGVVLAQASGSVEGRFGECPEGTEGFGYDPYFVPDGEAHSMAALSAARRMALSHRGRALEQLLQKFHRMVGLGLTR